MVNAAAQETTLGPGITPLSIESRTDTVMNPLPPRSLTVVTPVLIARKAFLTANTIISFIGGGARVPSAEGLARVDQMHMGVHETGHDGHTPAVDDLRSFPAAPMRPESPPAVMRPPSTSTAALSSAPPLPSINLRALIRVVMTFIYTA